MAPIDGITYGSVWNGFLDFLLTSPTSRYHSSVPSSVPRDGLFTFAVEGSCNPASRWYSRRAHQPSPSSGVTIGRGYDMRERSGDEVLSDLLDAGLDRDTAVVFSAGAGLTGVKAKNFIKHTPLPDISSEVEGSLFAKTWRESEDDVLRILSKPDVVETYGKTDWEALNPAIRQMVVDLRFRGDYTPYVRSFLQPSIVENDLLAFKDLLTTRSLWKGVPRNRFEGRKEFLLEALDQ